MSYDQVSDEICIYVTKGIEIYVKVQRRFIRGSTGVIMGVQVPLLIIDQREISIMSGVLPNRGVTHLRVDNAWDHFRNYRN